MTMEATLITTTPRTLKILWIISTIASKTADTDSEDSGNIKSHFLRCWCRLIKIIIIIIVVVFYVIIIILNTRIVITFIITQALKMPLLNVLPVTPLPCFLSEQEEKIGYQCSSCQKWLSFLFKVEPCDFLLWGFGNGESSVVLFVLIWRHFQRVLGSFVIHVNLFSK